MSNAARKPILRPDEELAWMGFLLEESTFAGEPLSQWYPGPDPPDILAFTTSKRTVGIELTQWVEHDQLSTGKAREFFEKSYLKVIRSEDEIRPEHIGTVWLFPKGRRVRSLDAALFRKETFEFLERQNGLPEPEWDNPQGAPINDFVGFPMLAKYMESFWIFPRGRFKAQSQEVSWVCFRLHGGAYSTDWMVQAAIDRIFAKIEVYEALDLHGKYGLQELILLCHYSDEALLHNTPLRELASASQTWLRKSPRLWKKTMASLTASSSITRGKAPK
jgi:hypothetical protein